MIYIHQNVEVPPGHHPVDDDDDDNEYPDDGDGVRKRNDIVNMINRV